MNDYSFDILGWNPINTNGNLMASIYIKPTLRLLSLFNLSVHNNILLKCSNTEIYDDIEVFGIIDKSSDVLNSRDNFFNCTGLYVITTDFLWNGYPPNNGMVSFLTGSINEIIKLEEHKDPIKYTVPVKTVDTNTTTPTTQTKLSNTTTIIILFIVLLLSISIIYAYLRM